MNIQQGLRKLGDPVGKAEMDFVKAFGGNPMSITDVGLGQRCLQWKTGTFKIQHIAIIFDASHRYLSVSHRYGC